MDQTLTHRIRERAYEIWAANGCPNGEADMHWLTAEREVLTAAAPSLAAPLLQGKKSRRAQRAAARKSQPAIS